MPFQGPPPHNYLQAPLAGHSTALRACRPVCDNTTNVVQPTKHRGEPFLECLCNNWQRGAANIFANARMPAVYDQFFLFGDSITQDSFSQDRGFGFSAALQAAYIRRLDVVNRGQSGYNTRQALQVLPHIVPSPSEAKIRFLTVFFGANDASLADAPNKQHIPLQEYKDNLEKIITHPQIVAHNPRIVLIAPAPLNEHLWWPRDQVNGYSSVTRLASTTKEYAEAACEVGAKLNIPVVNLWKAFMARTDFNVDAWKIGDSLTGGLDLPQNDALVELMYDGLHFHPAGYDILYKELMTLIAQVWPDQTPEQLPMVLPAWNDSAAWDDWTNAHK